MAAFLRPRRMKKHPPAASQAQPADGTHHFPAHQPERASISSLTSSSFRLITWLAESRPIVTP